MSVIDTTSLFLHVLSAVGMVGGGVAQIYAGSRVRAVQDAPRLREWLRATRLAGLAILAAAVGSLLTGGHLAGAVWTTDARSGFAYPFITLGVAALVLLAPVGPMMGGRRIRGLLAELPETGDAAPATRGALGDPWLWGPIHSLSGVTLALVAVMVYKPESWAVTGIVLIVGFVAGWVSGAAVADRTTSGASAAA